MQERQAIPLLLERLQELLDTPAASVQLGPTVEGRRADLVLRARGLVFVIEYRAQARTQLVAHAVMQVRAIAEQLGSVEDADVVPVVAVPYMGDVGRAVCREHGVAWLDLSGNASIAAPNLRILVEGQPNKFVQRGRPPDLFTPRRARIVRRLLLEPRRRWSQAELARTTESAPSQVHTVAHALSEAGLLAIERYGLTLTRPSALLEIWAEAYRFDRHRLLAGHVTARSGPELLDRVVGAFREVGPAFALTGLAAAWRMAPMAQYRLVSLYARGEPGAKLLDGLGFRPESRGANLWLLMPDDEGVFDGEADWEGVPCVSPLQVWLDLKHHPERAQEAAAELQKACISWSLPDA